MAIKDVTVVSVPVSDPDAAREFYVDTLGFDLLADDSSMPGMRWLQVSPKGGPVSLALVTWFETMPAGSLQGLVMTSTDLQADYDTFQARSVRFDGPPEVKPWATETVLRDPDGNGIVLQQARA